METALYEAFSPEGGGDQRATHAHGRGTAKVRMRSLQPPRPRWEDNQVGMEELFQCERSAHARKVGRTFTAVRGRLRKGAWTNRLDTEFCGATQHLRTKWTQEVFPGAPFGGTLLAGRQTGGAGQISSARGP